jgi:xanthine dehydrogenase accessory factor
MKELKAIIEAYDKIDFTKNKAALATVVRVEGSSYRRTGARMLVMESGEWIGGISGGCLEGDALKKARLAMTQNKPTLITYDTSDDDPYQIGVGLGCNGIIDVLITPLNPDNLNNAILQVKNHTDTRTPNLVVTVIGLSKTLENIRMGDVFRYDNEEYFKVTFPLQLIDNQLLSDISFCLNNLRSLPQIYELADGTKVRLFLEILPPTIHLVIYGTNYDIYPFVRIAKEIGWKVTVICNPQKVHASLFQTADEVLPKDSEPIIDDYTVAILMSHDYENDYQSLMKLLKSHTNYIGMLGPAKRNKKMYDRMAEEGKPISEADLARIYNPAGLDIGATTPEEIAISIVAEIRAFFGKRNGSNLRLRTDTIHSRD